MLFDRAKMRHLPAVQSDHSPIFIFPNGFTPIHDLNLPFKFQATWLTHEHFQEVVKDKWNPNSPLVPSLENLAHELKT